MSNRILVPWFRTGMFRYLPSLGSCYNADSDSADSGVELGWVGVRMGGAGDAFKAGFGPHQ